MSKKKSIQQKLKIMSLISLLLCSTVAVGISTVCWFFADKNRYEGMESIEIYNDQNTFAINYNVYGFDRLSKEGKLLYTQDTGFDFVLDGYDALLGKNDYLSQIIEFKIKTEQVNAPSGNIELDIPVDANFIADESARTVAEFMSNMIEFRACLGSYVDINGNTVNAFEMSDINRYYHDFDETSTRKYLTSADKIYQETHYELEKLKYDHHHYIPEDEIIDMPTDEEEFVRKMKEINNLKVNINHRNLHITIDPMEGEIYSLPYGYKEATFYLQFDYSDILTLFFSHNKNATIGETTKIDVESDFNRIKVGVNK